MNSLRATGRVRSITLDILMSNKDGWKVLNDLKADPATGRTTSSIKLVTVVLSNPRQSCLIRKNMIGLWRIFGPDGKLCMGTCSLSGIVYLW